MNGASAVLKHAMKAFHFRPSTHTVFGYASYAMIPGLNQLTLEEKVGQVVCFGWSPVDGARCCVG